MDTRKDHVWDNLDPRFFVCPAIGFRDYVAVVVDYGVNGRDEVRNLVDSFEGFFDNRHFVMNLRLKVKRVA